jgi:predicted nucleic acid-binding protein
MKTVFADTGYWIALLNPNDQLHYKAKNVTAYLMPSLHIVTSEIIFTELLNAFSKQGSLFRRAAVNLINQSISNPHIEVVSQTSDLFLSALKLTVNVWIKLGAIETVPPLKSWNSKIFWKRLLMINTLNKQVL